jgi:hypothetical protein
MRYAQLVFRVAGIYGVLVLLPIYFLEARIGMEAPPAITHPEFFYGFIGVGLAWQVGFLLIGRDPVRFRPLMPAAMLEKFIHVAAMTVLWSRGRVAGAMMPPVAVDLLLGALFVAAYRRTPAAIFPETRMPQPVRG